MPKTEIDILDDVLKTLSSPEKWTKGTYARDIDTGKKVSLGCPEDTSCFCLAGAMIKSLLHETTGEVFKHNPIRIEYDLRIIRIKNVMKTKFRHYWFGFIPVKVRVYDVISFNDLKLTTYDDIIELVRRTRKHFAFDIYH